MPLLRNTSQPFFPDPNSPNRYGCSGEYCWPINEGDLIPQQWYQTPCDNSQIEDPEFEDVSLGGELISNGDFATDLTDWSEAPGGAFIWTASGAEFQNASGRGSQLEQPGLAITPGTQYRLSIDVSGLTSTDWIEIFIGGTEPFIVITQNGTTLEFDGIAGSDNTSILIVSESDNDFTIDNVSLKEVTSATWDNAGVWTLSDGQACKTIVGTGTLEELVADYITADGYYLLTFEVTGWNGLGTLVPMVSDATPLYSETVTGNGIFTFYFEPTITGVVSFVPSSDWQGCITILTQDTDEYYAGLRELRNDFLFEIIGPDMMNGDVYDISGDAVYYKQWITVNFNPESIDLPFGCYLLRTYDACLISGTNLIANGSFSDGGASWTTGSGSISYAGGEATVTFDPITGGSNIISNGDFSGGTTDWTTTGWSVAGGAATHTPGNTNSLTQSVTITTPAIPPAFKLWWFAIQMSNRTAGSITIELDDATSGGYSQNGVWVWRLAPTNGGTVDFKITPTSEFDGDITGIILVEVVIPHISGGTFYNPANPLIVTGNYEMEFEITNINDVLGSGAIGAGAGITAMAQATVYETTAAVHTVSIPNYVPGTQTPFVSTNFTTIDPAGGVRGYIGSISIDSVELVRVEPFEATYESECINYQLSHPRTKAITGYSDQNAFGLEFVNTGYMIFQRVYCRSIAPTYRKQSNIAEFGTGDASLKYSEITKVWQLHTAPMSESAHDCLAIQSSCDHFIISDTIGTGNEYVADGGDYTPNWNGSGSYDLATGTLDLRLKLGGQLYNRHT